MELTFADVLRASLAHDAPARLLFLFAQVDQFGVSDLPEHKNGTLVPVMVADKLLASDLSFPELVAEADAITPLWDVMIVALLAHADGDLPRADDAQRHLQMMADAVLDGHDLSRFLAFDRAENALRIEQNQ